MHEYLPKSRVGTTPYSSRPTTFLRTWVALKCIPLLLAITALKCAFQHYWLQSSFICWPRFQILLPRSNTIAGIALASIAMTLPISACSIFLAGYIQLQADFNSNKIANCPPTACDAQSNRLTILKMMCNQYWFVFFSRSLFSRIQEVLLRLVVIKFYCIVCVISMINWQPSQFI